MGNPWTPRADSCQCMAKTINGYGLSEEELWQKMTQEAQLGFNRGKDFGEAGNGFFRINLACPRTTVEDAMKRLKAVFG